MTGCLWHNPKVTSQSLGSVARSAPRGNQTALSDQKLQKYVRADNKKSEKKPKPGAAIALPVLPLTLPFYPSIPLYLSLHLPLFLSLTLPLSRCLADNERCLCPRPDSNLYGSSCTRRLCFLPLSVASISLNSFLFTYLPLALTHCSSLHSDKQYIIISSLIYTLYILNLSI